MLATFEQNTGIPFFPAPCGLIVIGNIDDRVFYYRSDPKVRQLSQLVHIDFGIDKAYEVRASISQFLYDSRFNRLPAEWSRDLGSVIWRDASEPFFTPVKKS